LATSLAKIGARVGLDRAVSFVFDRRSAREGTEEILAIKLRKAAIARPSMANSMIRGSQKNRSKTIAATATMNSDQPKLKADR
jgi:hypothetical protein